MKMPNPIAIRFAKLIFSILSITVSGVIFAMISHDHTPIVKLLNYAESVAKRLKSALPGSAKYYLIIRRTEL